MPDVPELAYFARLIHETIDQLHLMRLEKFEPPAEMSLNSYNGQIRDLYGLKWRNFQDATSRNESCQHSTWLRACIASDPM